MSDIYPNTIKIRVTASDIFRGWCKSQANCALAKAFTDEFELEPFEVSVSEADILIRDSYFNVIVRYAHTKKSVAFMRKYDDNKRNVKPDLFLFKKLSEVTREPKQVTKSEKLV